MSRKILLVEDHKDTREVLAALLTGRGFDVAVAVDGLDGLEQACAFSPDLILADMHMPNLSGLGMIEQARQIPALSAVPSILISADRSGERLARAAGADRFVKKPMAFDDLMEAIQYLLGRRRSRGTSP